MLTGQQLKIHRIIKGIKANVIAKELGVSNAFVTYMEQEKRPIPNDKYVVWMRLLGL